MGTSFDYILKYLQENYDFTPNQAPQALVHGGTHNFFDLSDQLRYNTQIILLAHEFKQEDGYFVSERVRSNVEEQLGVQFLPYQYDELQDLEKVIDDFSAYFKMPLDKTKIIRRLPQKHRDSFFTLYVAVLQLPYYH